MDVSTLERVQYVPFSPIVHTSFWSRLTDLKLREYHLDENPRSITATYSNCHSFSGDAATRCPLNLDFDAFNSLSVTSKQVHKYHGDLIVFNTLEKFNSFDKNKLLSDHGRKIFESISSFGRESAPDSLNRFILLVFADLKKYRYYYWFAFPAIGLPSNINCSHIQFLHEVFDGRKIELLARTCQSQSVRSSFLIEVVDELDDDQPFRLRNLGDLKDFPDNSRLILGFCDPSSDPRHLGWPLRNFLALWSHSRPNSSSVRVLCWRYFSKEGNNFYTDSLLLTISYENKTLTSSDDLKTYGWLKNERGQLAPQFVNLSKVLDPKSIANDAVALNLQLMRWRLVPDLSLERIFDTKCLLFGAGTLGCNIARCLLGWGIRNVTLVDSSTVSYSNPVRQNLFTFDDCSAGGRYKAEAAADALNKIFPGAIATGVVISVPMPGHSISSTDLDRVKLDVDRIETLIKSHDVIFVLFDSREGRWFPSAFSALHRKLVISAALGFDSFLVMRHGVGQFDQYPLPINPMYLTGDTLGCYFCSDVNAPTDSLTDRTLDQQCTVTRPGSSFIASGLAVELMISTIQHPERELAPAVCRTSTRAVESFAETEENDPSIKLESCLGTVPHQIRGFLSKFEQFTPTVQRFSKCVCCSTAVLSRLQDEIGKFDFLLRVFNDSSTLEQITGLDELKKDSCLSDVLEFSDNDSFTSD